MSYRQNHVALLLLICLSIVSGCQHTMRDMGANVLTNMGNKYIQPWFFGQDDMDLFCGVGEGMTAMVFPLGPNVDPMVPMLSLASGACADERSKEAELRYIRALSVNDGPTAQDARTMQKRWARVSAKRQFLGYQASIRAYGSVGRKGCPMLRKDDEQLAYLFGQLGGIQAVFADFASGGGAGIPYSLLPSINKNLACLDNDLLWGVPSAVRATISVILATAGNEEEKIATGLRKLRHAREIGESKGVRLVDYMIATLYSTQGDDENLKQTIRIHAASKKNNPPNPALQLLDHMASRSLLLMSDKLWTQATGHRTPFDKFGTFWDDKLETGTLDVDDLL